MIPSYEEFMYPLLEILSDDEVHKTSDFQEALAQKFNLSEEARNKYLPSGRQLIYKNRIGWASTYLFKAGLVQKVKRGHYQISDEGVNVLKDPLIQSIDRAFLLRYESFQGFIKPTATESEEVQVGDLNPEEQLNKSYNELKDSVKNDLLYLIMDSTPKFFEELVVKLLVSMGYGGSIEDAGEAIGKSGDEGIDGIIKEDILGLDMIYIQAKRWQGSVGRPEIQKFAGSLAGKQAHKGVFITTSDYSKEAKDYVRNLAMNIILINGDELTEFMYEYNIGVVNKSTYVIKSVNEAFFED